MTICKRYQDGDDLHDIARADNGKFQNRYTLRHGPDGHQQPASTAGYFDTLEQAAAAMHKHRPAAVEIAHSSEEENAVFEQASLLSPDLEEAAPAARQPEDQPQDNPQPQDAPAVKYYPIDETVARISHQMMSMSDYPKNSATNEYRAAVDEAAALVQRKKSSVSPYYHDKLDALLDRYARRLAQWTNDHNRNGASCPSVMICGPANFPTRKKEKQIAREDNLWREYNEIKGLLKKIDAIGTGPVDLADPYAREMLTDQLQRLQNDLDTGKAMNAHYRKHKTMKGFRDFSDEAADKMDDAISGAPPFAQTPMPDFHLSSLRGKIKRLQENIAKLDSMAQHKDDPENTLEFDGGKIFLNMEENRLQILFDEIPGEETRSALKSNGFRWSRKNEAWQRQLTRNAVYAAKSILGLN